MNTKTVVYMEVDVNDADFEGHETEINNEIDLDRLKEILKNLKPKKGYFVDALDCRFVRYSNIEPPEGISSDDVEFLYSFVPNEYGFHTIVRVELREMTIEKLF